MSRSERVVQQLGMSHGAATSRLRKLVLFRQLQKCHDNICIRCNNVIATADELSIEHIEPWEGRSAELFWDLDNVAFAHMKCNLLERHTRSKEIGEKQRKIGPEGTSWCKTCSVYKSLIEFAQCSSNWRGLDTECKPCKNLRNASRDRRKILSPVGPAATTHLS